MLLAQPCHRAVIHHEAVFAQHQAVTGAADRQGRDQIAIDKIQKGGGIAALHLDLAERRDIAQANAGPHRQHFAVDRLAPMGLAGFRHILRAQPQAGLDKHSALLDGPLMGGGQARGPEMPVPMRPSQGTDGDRRIGRTKHGCADIGNAGAAQARHHRQPRDIGGLALIRTHAERGVTLEMFDRAITLPMRQHDIIAGHIMLQIDKGLALARHAPDGDAFLRFIRT